jgi:hypothetical protein
MFDFFKKKQPQGSQLHLTITGMHCTSCAMNIDGVLEETDGVLTAPPTSRCTCPSHMYIDNFLAELA